MSTVVDAASNEQSPTAIESARTWRDRWQDNRFPVLCFVGVAAVLYLVVFATTEFLSRNSGYPIQIPLVFRGARVLEGWVRYDGGWYRHIATTGCLDPNDCGYNYHPGAQSSVAFFPAYPLSMRAVAYGTGDVLLAGIIITFLSGLAMTVLFYKWCRRLLSTATAKVAVVMLLVFPYAWYLYGAVYADALFLVCTVGAFVLVEKDRPVLAGLLAAVATAARPVGIGVVIGLVAVHLDRREVIVIPYFDRVRTLGWRGALAKHADSEVDADVMVATDKASKSRTHRWPFSVSPRRLRLKDAGVLLSATGLGTWVAYLGIAWGNPFIFMEIEGVPGWDQAQGPKTWFKVHWLGLLHHFPEYAADQVGQWEKFVYTLGVSFQGLLAVACMVAIPLVIRRIGWSYAVYVLAVVAIPMLGTKDWQGTGRYLLAAFPVFAALADWLLETERTKLSIGLMALSAAILVFMTSSYARGYYLA